MKKIIALSLVVLSLFSNFSIAFGYSDDIVDSQISALNKINTQALKELEKNNIQVIVTKDNKIALENNDEETIKIANEILDASKSSYPGPWVKMNNYSYSTSKKFRAATKTAFASVLEAWIVEKVYLPSTLAARAAAAFGTYYFVSTDEENVYYFKEYHYRELSAGYFDSLGNFIGDYQIRKTERTTRSSNGTGGQTYIQYEYSSIVTPTI